MPNPDYEDSLIFKSNVKGLKGYYVYVFWHEDTPFYVGMGQKNRWRQHFHNSPTRLLKDNPYKYHKIRKIIDSGSKVGVEIVKDGLTKEEAQEIEVALIAKYKRKVDGGVLTNMSTGGESGASGRPHTEEHKNWMSVYQRGQNSKVTEDLVYKAKLLYHYRGIKPKDIVKLPEYSHLTKEAVSNWISKSNPNYSYVAPHLKCEKELRQEKREEVRKLWDTGRWSYKNISDILGLDRHFVARACKGE